MTEDAYPEHCYLCHQNLTHLERPGGTAYICTNENCSMRISYRKVKGTWKKRETVRNKNSIVK